MYRFTPTSWAARTTIADVDDSTSFRRSVPAPITLTTASNPVIALRMSLASVRTRSGFRPSWEEQDQRDAAPNRGWCAGVLRACAQPLGQVDRHHQQRLLAPFTLTHSSSGKNCADERSQGAQSAKTAQTESLLARK